MSNDDTVQQVMFGNLLHNGEDNHYEARLSQNITKELRKPWQNWFLMLFIKTLIYQKYDTSTISLVFRGFVIHYLLPILAVSWPRIYADLFSRLRNQHNTVCLFNPFKPFLGLYCYGLWGYADSYSRFLVSDTVSF